MSRARAKGVKIGRPKLPAELRHEITSRAAKGLRGLVVSRSRAFVGYFAPLSLSLTHWVDDLGALFEV
jgi:hypothetical protein